MATGEKVELAKIYYQDNSLFFEVTRDCDTYQLYGFLKAKLIQMEEDFKNFKRRDLD